MAAHNSTYVKASIKKFIEFLQFEYDLIVELVQYPRNDKKPKEINPLSREEIQILIDNLPEDESLFKFMLPGETLSRTGMRISEVVALRIENIDFVSWQKDESKNGAIILTKTKGDYPRRIPIKPDLMVKLMEVCSDPKTPEFLRDENSFVFDFNHARTMKRYRKKQLKREKLGLDYYPKELWDTKYIEKSVSYFKKIIRRTAIKVLKKPTKSHIFRHSFLSYLDSLGVKPHIIQRVAGHKNFNTTSKYLHPTEEEMSVTAI